MGDIIRERKEKRLVERDLLGCLLESRDDKGEVLREEQIADNIIGVLFAAQDTTASVMTWIVKYLHDEPKLLEAVKVRINNSVVIVYILSKCINWPAFIMYTEYKQRVTFMYNCVVSFWTFFFFFYHLASILCILTLLHDLRVLE